VSSEGFKAIDKKFDRVLVLAVVSTVFGAAGPIGSAATVLILLHTLGWLTGVMYRGGARL
jgi:uncharacterized membrane protein YqaE (UPF0057 family)